jgi:hypothetical protein
VTAAGIIVAALFYAMIGLAALLRPERLLEGFGILVGTPDSRNEIRAVYGGFPLAVAGLLVFCLTGTPFANGILLALALASGGIAAGRLVSAGIDRQLGLFPAIFTVLELIAAGLIATGIQP